MPQCAEKRNQATPPIQLHDAMSDSTHLHINASFGSTSDQHMLRIRLMSQSDGVITGQDALTIGLGICAYTIRRTPN
jgi:hypothetical protein